VTINNWLKGHISFRGNDIDMCYLRDRIKILENKQDRMDELERRIRRLEERAQRKRRIWTKRKEDRYRMWQVDK
jgi:hypothetical protein